MAIESPLRPLRDYIVVKPIERVMSHSFVVINRSERPNLGTVVACGPKANGVSPGDTVRFGEFQFKEYTDDDFERFLVMQEADVAAVVEAV